MRKTLIMAALFATISGFAQNTQCTSTTKKGDTCLLVAWNNELCWRHNPEYVKKAKVLSTACTGTTKAGSNCSLRTRDVSGICHHHRIKKD